MIRFCILNDIQLFFERMRTHPQRHILFNQSLYNCYIFYLFFILNELLERNGETRLNFTYQSLKFSSYLINKIHVTDKIQLLCLLIEYNILFGKKLNTSLNPMTRNPWTSISELKAFIKLFMDNISNPEQKEEFEEF